LKKNNFFAEVVLLNWLATLLPESEQAFFH